MFTFQDLYERLQKMAGYDSAADIQWGKDTINEVHKYYAGLQNWNWTNDTFTSTTTASQSTIKLPADYRKLIRFTLTVGGVEYTPEEVSSPRIFSRLSSVSSTSDYPSYFHIRGKQLLVYPALASAGNTINIEYQRRPVDMTADDHTTGSIVSVANGATTVEGTGTPLWTAAMVGRHLQITSEGQWYKIASITDADTLELDIPYEGTSIAAATEAYRISELPILPEDYQELLWMLPLSRWYMMKSDEERANMYIRWANNLLRDMKKQYAFKSHINTSRSAGSFTPYNPNYNSRSITIT